MDITSNGREPTSTSFSNMDRLVNAEAPIRTPPGTRADADDQVSLDSQSSEKRTVTRDGVFVQSDVRRVTDLLNL